MANLKDVIYLSNTDFETLVTNGTVTINGTTLTYDENSLYITPDEGDGTVKSVRVQAGTGLSSSQSTAQTETLDTTISIASGYKLPTTTEWNSKYTKPSGGIPASDLAESYYLASNPSGYITSTALSNYVTLDGTQTISGQKTFTAARLYISSETHFTSGGSPTDYAYGQAVGIFGNAMMCNILYVPQFKYRTSAMNTAGKTATVWDLPYLDSGSTYTLATTNDIPTKTSQLTNDSDFITSGAISNMVTTSSTLTSDKIVVGSGSKAVGISSYSVSDLKNIAEGKTTTYTTSLVNGNIYVGNTAYSGNALPSGAVAKAVTSSTNSISIDTATYQYWYRYVSGAYVSVKFSDMKAGDNILITQTDVPDFWYSGAIAGTGTVYFYKLETTKVVVPNAFVGTAKTVSVTGTTTGSTSLSVANSSSTGSVKFLEDVTYTAPSGTPTTKYLHFNAGTTPPSGATPNHSSTTSGVDSGNGSSVASSTHTHTVTVSGTTGTNSGTAVEAMTSVVTAGSISGTRTTTGSGTTARRVLTISHTDPDFGYTDVAPDSHTHSYGSSTALTTGNPSATTTVASHTHTHTYDKTTSVSLTAGTAPSLTANTSSSNATATYLESYSISNGSVGKTEKYLTTSFTGSSMTSTGSYTPEGTLTSED